MKKLILVRHGEYEDDGLSLEGKEQISRLGNKLKRLIDEQTIILLTSIAGRAKESAEILADIFEVEFEEHDVLLSENSHPENHPSLLELVRSKKDSADVLILITHLEYTEDFPDYFARRELDETRFSTLGLEKGEAWIIDCESKSMGKITH